MLKWAESKYSKTSSLRSIHYGPWPNDDRVITRMGQLNKFPRERKIVGYPRVGWGDDWDKSGKHYSKRTRRQIMGRVRHTFESQPPHFKQERAFKYAPRITWDDNPASWEDLPEVVIELEY